MIGAFGVIAGSCANEAGHHFWDEKDYEQLLGFSISINQVPEPGRS
jgi:hypothetical protein